MKTMICLLGCLWLSMTATAQGVFSNQTNTTLRKVIEDYRFNTKKEYSWSSKLFTSPDFDKAKSKFSELYQQLHNTIIKFEGEKPVILNGLFEMPDKARQQTSIFFHFLPATGVVQKLKVELVLQYTGEVWNISLMVYEPQEVDYRVTS